MSSLRIVLARRNITRIPFGRGSARRNTDQGQPVIPAAEHTLGSHPDPVVELRRIYEVVKVRMLPFIEALPT